MWTFIARTILRNRILFLGILALITAFMGYKAGDVQMSYQYAPLLPEDDPAFIEYKNFEEVFENEGNLMVLGVQDNSFFKLNNYNNWVQLSADIDSVEGVSSVLSVSEAYDLVKNKKEKRFEIVPLFKNKVFSQFELDSIKISFILFHFTRVLFITKKTVPI